jgi:hypothetical protein
MFVMVLDFRRAESAVSTLEGQELTQLAAQAQRVESALAGGQSNIGHRAGGKNV